MFKRENVPAIIGWVGVGITTIGFIFMPTWNLPTILIMGGISLMGYAWELWATQNKSQVVDE